MVCMVLQTGRVAMLFKSYLVITRPKKSFCRAPNSKRRHLHWTNALLPPCFDLRPLRRVTRATLSRAPCGLFLISPARARFLRDNGGLWSICQRRAPHTPLHLCTSTLPPPTRRAPCSTWPDPRKPGPSVQIVLALAGHNPPDGALHTPFPQTPAPPRTSTLPPPTVRSPPTSPHIGTNTSSIQP